MKRRTRVIVLPAVVALAMGSAACQKCDDGGGSGGGNDNSGGDVFMPSPAAHIRYVATTGRDNGTCTVQTSPCLTIQYALTQSVNTDIIEIDRGSYRGNIKIDHNDITIRGAGSNLSRPRGHNSPNPQIAQFQIPHILKSPNQIHPQILKSLIP